MTQVIDGKVVEMKFDNSDFERNVAQSMSTLEKLKQALNFDSAKGLESVSKASKNFDMSSVGSAVETVQAKFSALQVIGITALSELTKAAMHFGANVIKSVVDPIASGGMNRAMNIEQAKFQLEGLHVAWSEIEDDINYGVKDTAYGLDVAAKAASQLTASGVAIGDEMKAALRGISGVAAMTSSSYEEISPIFTTVAGQGKLMTMQLRQLESRGLNAAATLGDYLGKTEAEIRELVTDGKIDFQTFANAMDDAFGAHAKDANKTFTGAMSNVRAALSRIGANFATPYMENMRKIAVEAIQVINGINKAMQPIYDIVSSIMEKIQGKITDFLGNVALKDAYTRIINGIVTSFYALLGVLMPIKRAFKDIFPKDFIWILRDAAKSFEAFTQKLIISDEAADKIRRTFKGVFAVFDIFRLAIKAVFDAIRPFTGGLGDILGNILDFSAGMGDYLVSLRDSIKANDTFGKAFKKAADIIVNAGSKIKEVLNNIVEAFKNFKANHIDNKDFSGFTGFVDAVKNRLASMGTIGDILKKVFDKIKFVITNFAPIFEATLSTLGRSIGAFLSGLSNAFRGDGGDPFSAFVSIFSTATLGHGILTFSNTLESLRQQIKNVGGLSPTLYKLKDGIRAFFITVQADIQADMISRIGKAIAIFAGSILLLSLINPVRLTSSMIAIEVLMGTIKDITAFMNNVAKQSTLWDAASMKLMATSLTTIGSAILILAISIKILSTIDIASLVTSMTAIIILIESLVKVTKELKGTEVTQCAGTLLALAVAVRILAGAVKTLGKMDTMDLAQGLLAVLVMVKMLSMVISEFKTKEGEAIAGAGALIAMAVAIDLLIVAVKVLGTMDFEDLVQGMIAVAAGLGIMVYALKWFTDGTNAGQLAASAASLIILTLALQMLSVCIVALGKMNPQELATGLLAVVVGLAAMVYGLKMLTDGTNAADLAASAGSLILLGTAVLILSAALKVLSTINIGVLVADLVILLAAFAGFAFLSAVFAEFLPFAAAAAGVVALLGVGVLALGAGVVMLSAGLISLATACTSVVANLGAILLIISALIPAIAIALANGIIQFVVAIGNGAAQIIEAVVNLGKALLQAIIELVPSLVEAFVVVIKGLVDVFVELIPYFVEAGMKFMIGLMDGISRQLPELVRAGNELMISFINSLADGIRRDTPRIIEATDNLMSAIGDAIVMWFSHFTEKGSDIVHKIIEGIKQVWDTIKGVGEELVDKAAKGIEEGLKNIVQLGKDLVDGFIKGIKEAPGKVWDAAKGVAQNALDAISNTQKSNSPAKEGISRGKDLSEGYAIGISDGREDIQHSAEDATNGAIDTFESAQERIAALRKDIMNNQSWYTKAKRDYQKSTETDTKLNKELREEHIKVKKAEDDTVKSTEDLTKAQDGLATATGKSSKAAKEQKDVFEKIKDSITSSIDIFSKFELKTELTGTQLLENMKSNIDGVASWTAKLNSLIDKGISKELYDKLAEMGPKSYEQVNAFTQMTGEQLAQANEYFAQSLTIGDTQTAIIKDSYDRVGVNVAQGAINGLKAKEGEMNATAMAEGKGLTDAMAIGAGVASPSTLTYQTGLFIMDGLNNGMKARMPYIEGTVSAICRRIIGAFTDNLRPSNFYEIGVNLTLGLANGIADSDAAGRVIEEAANIARIAKETMEKVLDEHSPSRVTMQIGRYASEGLAIGLVDAASNVYRAAKSVAEGAIEGLSDNSRIQDVLDSELDLNPVITPMLDLSVMRAQLSSISSMFNDPAYGLSGQNGGHFSAGDQQPSTINFTQNNYSPKELSRYDIYRNTRNQINMMKGVIAHA